MQNGPNRLADAKERRPYQPGGGLGVEDVIEPSGEASLVVQGWLESMSGGSSLPDEREQPGTELEVRPPRLGLGAKYLGHAKAVAAMGAVERKLRAKIGATERGASPRGRREGDTPAAGRGGPPRGGAGAGVAGEDESEEEEEVEESRASAFGGRKQLPGPDPMMEQMQGRGRRKKRKIQKEEPG